MLDNILNTVKRSAEKVQRRGEEVAQSARLRLEVYQLSRELDGLYNRLGRAYHAQADQAVLEGVRDEVRRLDEEIAAREHLIAELGEVPDDAPAQDPHHQIHAAAARTRMDQTPPAPPAPTQASEPNLGDLADVGQDAAHPVPPSDAPPVPSVGNAPPFVERPVPGQLGASQPTASTPATPTPPTAVSRIWRAKQEERMIDDRVQPNEVKPDGPDNENVGMDLGKELPPRREEYTGVGDESGREQMRRHPHTLEEGDQATRNPDPLDK